MALRKLGSVSRISTVVVTNVDLASDVGSSILLPANGGTGFGSYADGNLLIGKTAGNTLVKSTLTGTANQVIVTNGSGTITLSLPQDIGTSSAPTFATMTATSQVDTALLTHAGHIDITPATNSYLDLNYGNGSGSGGVRFVSNSGEGIRLERASNTDMGTSLDYYTGGSAKWSIGPVSGADNWRIYNNTAGVTSLSIDGTTGIVTLLTPILGVPTSGTLTNCTGLPISTGVSGLGTGVATALGVNVGSAGAFVTFNGALGTPSSGTVTNLTGTASININGTVGATTPAAGTFTTLSCTGAFTAGDATGDTATFNADAWTFPTSVTITKTAETGVAETIVTMKVSDSASKFMIKNGTANASAFAPIFEGEIEASVNSTALSFFGTKGANDTTNPAILFLGRYNSGGGNTDLSDTTVLVEFRNRATSIVKFYPVNLTFVKDPYDIVLGTSTGTKIATSTSQKLSFWNKTPIVQPTTGITGATFTANAGTAVNDASTFGGYTLKQIAAALVNVGLLA